MTTDEATKILAGMLVDRFADGRGSMPLRRAVAFGRAWHFSDAGGALRSAYAALGAEPPAQSDRMAGYAWHRGEHPIQLAAAAAKAGRS